jgi:hypothetical protein
MRLAPFLLLLACAGGNASSASCDDADPLDAGAIAATVDGAAWASTATWVWQGESLQIDAAPADGWSFTLVAQTTADGATVKAGIDAGAFPIEVSLADGGGGWGRGHPSDGDPYITDDAEGGTLTLSALDGDALLGCFDFVAGDGGRKSVEVSDGALHAAPFSR